MTQSPLDALGDASGFRKMRAPAEGYEPAEVDRFVAELKAALRHEPPTMAPYEVADKRFTVSRLHGGYSMPDVDAFLDRAEALLHERHGADAVAELAGHVSTPARTPVWWVYLLAALAVAAVGYVCWRQLS